MTQILHRSFMEQAIKSQIDDSLNKSVDESIDQFSINNWKKSYYYNQLQKLISPKIKKEKELIDSAHYKMRKYSFEQNLTKIINQQEENNDYEYWVDNLSKKKNEQFQMVQKQKHGFHDKKNISNSELYFQKQVGQMNQKIEKIKQKIMDEQMSNYFENSSMTKKIQQREMIKNYQKELQQRLSKNDSYFQYKKNRYFLPKKIPTETSKQPNNEDGLTSGNITQNLNQFDNTNNNNNNTQARSSESSNSPKLNRKIHVNINNSCRLSTENISRKSPLLHQVLPPIVETARKRKIANSDDNLNPMQDSSSIRHEDSDQNLSNADNYNNNNNSIEYKSNVLKIKNSIQESSSSGNNTMNQSGQIMHTLNRRISKLRRLSTLFDADDLLQMKSQQQYQNQNQQQQQQLQSPINEELNSSKLLLIEQNNCNNSGHCSESDDQLQSEFKQLQQKKHITNQKNNKALKKLENMVNDDILNSDLQNHNSVNISMPNKPLNNSNNIQIVQQSSPSPNGLWLNIQKNNNSNIDGKSEQLGLLGQSNNLLQLQNTNAILSQKKSKSKNEDTDIQQSPLLPPEDSKNNQSQQNSPTVRFPRLILKRGISNSVSPTSNANKNPYSNQKTNNNNNNNLSFAEYLDNNLTENTVNNNNTNNNNNSVILNNPTNNSQFLKNSSILKPKSSSPDHQPQQKNSQFSKNNNNNNQNKIRSVNTSLAETQSTQPQSMMKFSQLSQRDNKDMNELPKLMNEIMQFVQSQFKSGKKIANVDILQIFYQNLKKQMEMQIFKIDQQLKIEFKKQLQRKKKDIQEKLKKVENINYQIMNFGQISTQITEMKEKVGTMQKKLHCKFENLNFFYDVLKIYEFPDLTVANVMVQIKQKELLDLMQNQHQDLETYKLEQLEKTNVNYVRALQEERLKKRKELLLMRKANFASKLYH